MRDDEPYSDPILTDEAVENDFLPPARRNCLFTAITLILILSLAGTSILAFFFTVKQSDQTSADGLIASVKSAPTTAPATVVAAVPTPSALVEPGQQTTISEVNRIAILNDEGQIETMSPMGQQRRVLTLRSDSTLFQFPAWAPDGRRLAVIGSRSRGGGIYVLEDAARTGGLAERQIYYSEDEAPFYLYWSPDSHNLAFLANDTRNTMALNIVAGDGSDESRLLATGAPFYWDWSHDGRQLLIHTGRTRANHSIALIDVEGNTQADNLAVPGNFQAPGIGQNNRYWAFAEKSDDGLSSLVVIDTQSGERHSYEKAGSMAISWSPAQNHIAFTNGALNGHPYWGPLYLLDVATGSVRLLSTQTVLAFFWSPDGRSIALITLSRGDNDDSINAMNEVKVRRVGRIESAPAQQRNRGMLTLSVIEVERGTGLRLLDFYPTSVYLSQFLPFFDQYALSHQIWSPDSSAIVLPVRDDDGNVILVVPVGGGAPFRLAEGDIAFWSQN